MTVLSVFGFPNGSQHDGGACIIQDGKVVAMIETERVTKVRHSYAQHPKPAIYWCFKHSGLGFQDIDIVATNCFPLDAYCTTPQYKNFAAEFDFDILDKSVGFSHHHAHAYGAWAQSPFKKTAILVIDGQGENESITIWDANANGITKFKSFDVGKSLGLLYDLGAYWCFHRQFCEGKLMGLAPFGKPKPVNMPIKTRIQDGELIINSVAVDTRTDTEKFYNNPLFRDFNPWIKETFGEKFDVSNPDNFEKGANLAATVQKCFEDNIMEICKWIASKGYKNLVFTGGCALNCTANAKIVESKLFDNVFIPPLCADNGIALGCAAMAAGAKDIPVQVYNTVEYGIVQNLDEVAKKLRNHEIVEWFTGGSEYGPRALGHRSFIALPDKVEMKDKLNKIKGREWWRPVAPVVRADVFEDIFECKPCELDKYMLINRTVNKKWRDKIPAVVHVDGTARPQIISDGLLYDLMVQYDFPVLVNTSLNVAGKPIIEEYEKLTR